MPHHALKSTIHTWQTHTLADAIDSGLRVRAQQDELEQVVYGFDHLDELGLHPLIHDSLRNAGLGVWHEQRYPDDWHHTRKSQGKRCDAVLTASPDQPLRDPLIRGTLFDLPYAVDPEQAYWLEIKTVAQFETSGPFPRYSAELLSPVVQDVKKLWTDSHIHHAGLLIILFTQDQPTAEHDLSTWRARCLERGYPVGPCCQRGFKINNRIGNAHCTAALFTIRG